MERRKNEIEREEGRGEKVEIKTWRRKNRREDGEEKKKKERQGERKTRRIIRANKGE